jgi:hypothetical protein
MLLTRITNSLFFGGDPELFLMQDGKVIGSEKVIPATGVKALQRDSLQIMETIKKYPSEAVYYQLDDPLTNSGRFIRDGVQVELNIPPHTCRALAGNDVSSYFLVLGWIQAVTRLGQLGAISILD